MDQWACDRRDMRVNDPRERIAAAACESLIQKTTCFAGLNFTTFSLPKSPARISAVDDEIASGEITARIGCKIHHGGRDLARFAEAAHRRQF
jgi:hypothetical protein